MASDYFLKLDGIDGESRDATHTSEIDLHSFSWGAVQPGTFANGSGGSAGKVSMNDVHFTFETNKASTELMKACASGKHIPSAIITCRKSTGDGGQQDYMTWTLKPVLVSSYTCGGSKGEEIPIDQMSLNYGSVKVEYKEQSETGSVQASGTFGWNLEKNQAF